MRLRLADQSVERDSCSESLVSSTRPHAHSPTSRPSNATSIGRGAMALLSTQPLTWAASLLTAGLVPHFLGDASLGDLTLAVAIAGLLGLLVSAGIPGSLARHV